MKLMKMLRLTLANCNVFLLLLASTPVLADVLTPQMFGAKCDGATDDSTAFQNALNAVGSGTTSGSALYLPPSPSGCRINSSLTYTVSSGGPLQISGTGPKSRVIWANSAGGLTINGSCGLVTEKVYLANFAQEAGGTGPVAFGIKLNGVAAYGLDNVSSNVGAQTLTFGIVGLGAQQGYIHGGYAFGVETDIQLNDCSFGATASSNGVDIGGGRTQVTTTTGIDIQGGAANVWIHGVHNTSSAKAIVVNQSNGTGGFGPNYAYANHFEQNGIVGVDVQAGTLVENGNNDYNITHARVASGATLVLLNNLINGAMTWDSGSTIFATGNTFLGVITNNTASSSITAFLNKGSGNSLQIGTHFNQAADFTSRAAVGGDILTLNPNFAIAGAWGASIRGAGTNADVYLKLNDAVVAGNTSGGILKFMSGVGGTTWGSASAGGITSATHFLNGGGVPNLSLCGASPSITGTDAAGTIRLGTGSPSSCTVTFDVAFPSAAWCTVTPTDLLAASVTYFISSQSSAGFSLGLGSGTNSASYNYSCGGK